jgi:hypothetical protein
MRGIPASRVWVADACDVGTPLTRNPSHLYDPRSRRTPRITKGRRDPGEGRRSALEAQSSSVRLAPSPGAQDSDGILRRPQRPRVDKREHEHRLRGSRPSPSERTRMRFVGIDVAAERHVVAGVDANGGVFLKPTAFTKGAEGVPKALQLPRPGPWHAGRHGGDRPLLEEPVRRPGPGLRRRTAGPRVDASLRAGRPARTQTDAIDALEISSAISKATRPPRGRPSPDDRRGHRPQTSARLVATFGDFTGRL